MKIGLITKQSKIAYRAFVKEASKLNHQLDLITTNKISLSFFSNSTPNLLLGESSLESYDVIYIRSLISDDELSTIISEYSRKFKIPIIDQIYQSPSFVIGKAFNQLKLSWANIPVIDGVFAAKENWNKILNDYNFPLVVKDSMGARGENVHLCHSRQEVESVFDLYQRHLLIQPFIPNDGDYRLVVVGDKCLGVVKRSRLKKDEFRNNVSLGGNTTETSLPEEITSLAVKAAQTLGYSIAGVDIIIDINTNQFYVMEVNRAPQLDGFMNATGINVPAQIVKYLTSIT